jgi:trigger factor
VPSTVEQLTPTRVKITVEVPFADLKPNVDKAYREIARSVNIPGFRKGKVPPLVIDQRFGRGAILQEAINDALPRLYGEAVAENHLNPLAQPEVEVTKLEDGDLLEFVAEVDVRPDFELPALDTLEVQVDAIDVSEDQVEEELTGLRNRFGSRKTVERPAQNGDQVTIDLVASKDGEPLDDATAQELPYEVGSGSMLDGLDDAVTGLSAGESATFSSSLVGGPRKGEDADIEVRVTTVAEQELPELDDEFAQLASEFDTVDELRDDLRERLSRMARLEQAAAARDAVLEELLSKMDVEVPENLVESDFATRKQDLETSLQNAQLTLEDYLADGEQTPEQFWDDLRQRTATALRAQLVLDKLADERELTVDQNDLTAHIIRKAQQENTAPQQIADHLQEHPHHIDEYMTEIRRGKALGVLVSAATITDSAGERVDLDRLRPDGSLADDQADDQPAGESDDQADDQASEAFEEISGESADNASISGGERETP